MQFEESLNFEAEQEQESFEQTCIFCHRIPQEIISLTCRHDFCLNCALKEVPNQDGEIPLNFFCKFCKKPTHLSEDLRQILIMLQKKSKKKLSTDLPNREGKFQYQQKKFGNLEKIFEVDSSSQQYDSRQSQSIEELKETPNFKMEFNQNTEIEKKVTIQPFTQNNQINIPKYQKFLRQSDLFYKKSTNTNQTEDNQNFDRDIKPQTILEGLEISNEILQQDKKKNQHNDEQKNDDEDQFQKSDQLKKKSEKNVKIDLQKLLQSLELKTKKGKSLQKIKHKNPSSKNINQKKFFLTSKKNCMKKSQQKIQNKCKLHQDEYQVLFNDKQICVKCHRIQQQKIEKESKSLRQNVTKEIEHEFFQKKNFLNNLLSHSIALQEQFVNRIDNMKKKGQLFYEQIKLSLEKLYKHFIEEVTLLERKVELNFEEYKIDISDKLNNCKRYMQTLQKTKLIEKQIEKKNKFEKSLQEENTNYTKFFTSQQENLIQFFQEKYFQFGSSLLKKFEQSSQQLFKFQFSCKIQKEDLKILRQYFGLDSSIFFDKLQLIKNIEDSLKNLEQIHHKKQSQSNGKKYKKKSSSNKRKTQTRKSFKKSTKNRKSHKKF